MVQLDGGYLNNMRRLDEYNIQLIIKHKSFIKKNAFGRHNNGLHFYITWLVSIK